MSLTRQRGIKSPGFARVRSEALLVRAQQEADALMVDSLDMATRIYQARREATHGASEERERCLKIVRQYPDNLMAREIAKQIADGRKP